ncbi:Pfs domain protein, partial [Aspergillus pseudoustus]
MASRHDYRIGWICALSIELATAKAMLDKIHPPLPNAKNDRNKYILGSIGPHNIVMTCLPAGVYGVTSATATAIQMRYSYDAIELCFMVGIAGAAPLDFDVRLGDVVVSEPTSIYGGVIQYDRGKAMNEGRIASTGSLDKPPEVLLKALCALKADHMLQGNRIQEFYSEAFERFPHLQGLISHPGTQNDHLFSPEYHHAISNPSCHQCDLSRVLTRASRPDNQPRVFYGLIASGNMLIKDAKVRDNLSQQYGILCFETEAAGLMDIFPSLVIRGICDYADSHKNKRWQGYAAAVAAAYTKELTLSLPSHEMMTSAPGE